MKKGKESGPGNTTEIRLEAWTIKGTPLPSAECDSRSSTEELEPGFQLPICSLILSVLITSFHLVEHGRQTWITREQAFATTPFWSFSQNDWFIFFSCMHYVCVAMCDQIFQKGYIFVTKAPAMLDSRIDKDTHPIWVSFKASYSFATSYQLVIKRFLPVYLMGDWPLCFYLAICSGLRS